MVEKERDVVLYRTEGPIARVTLNRPKYRNAQSYHLLDELDAALERAMADKAVAVVILEGAGGNFSSGVDMAGVPEWAEMNPLDVRDILTLDRRGFSTYRTRRRRSLRLLLDTV